MKIFVKSLFRCAPVVALCIACDGAYYTTPLNDKEAPVVEDILIGSTLASDELTGDEAAAFSFLVEEEQPVYEVFGWSYPLFKLNKLLNGETVEIVEKNGDTGADQSQCKAVDGAFDVKEGTTAVSSLRVCYNPGTLVLTVQASDDDNVARPFLAYDTTFTYTATANITDKHARALEAKTVTFHTQPFELLTAMDGDQGTVLYGANPFTAAETLEIPAGATSSGLIRLLFNGPMHGDAAIASLNGPSGIKLYDATDTEVTSGADMVTATAAFEQGENTLASDPRVLFVVTPPYQASEGMAGLEPGEYKLVIPPTATDDGSVTGTPVALGGTGPTTIAFTVVAAEAKR